MKVRLDFVSNSSSSSYVVACQADYLSLVAKDLAKACCNRRDPYHIKGLSKQNRQILDFCLGTFKLAFLGALVLETKQCKYDLKFFKKIYKSYHQNGIAEKEWNNYKKKLEDVKNGKGVPDWEQDYYGLDTYCKDTDTAIHYEKVKASKVVVSNDTMEYAFNRYRFNGQQQKEDDEKVKDRVDTLVKMAKLSTTRQDKGLDPVGTIGIYQITKDTIDNTRDMLKMGCIIDFERWEKDLDKLDACIARGDSIFSVMIAHSGDGFGNFHIYCEDGADGLDGVSGITIIASESL